MTPATLATDPNSTQARSVADSLLLPLDASLTDRLAGGKAAALGRMVAHGVPVPEGRVLTTVAFSQWLTHSGLGAAAATMRDGLAGPDSSRVATTATALRECALSSSLPREVDHALDEAFEVLSHHGPLIVRSSAVGEDGDSASFAGQLDSVLHVRTRDDLARAVRACWASAWSDRAVFYRRARGVPLDDVAVVIQRQVDPTCAGVLFTRDPQMPDSIVVEYCRGLADGLVSGTIDPDRLRVTRSDVDAGHRLDLPEVFSGAGLFQTALTLERLFGRPQDVEWAIDHDGTLWIVQARPITTPIRASGAEPTTCWSNANVNENFPGPISPLLYSIASTGYYHYFRNLGLAFGVSRRRLRDMDVALRGIVGVHGARLYYNLTNIHAVLRMAPYGEALAEAFNRFTGAAGTAPSPPGAVGWATGRLAQALELTRIAACTTWQYAWLRQRIEQFEHTADAFAATTAQAQLGRDTLATLAGHLQRFIDIRQRRWKNASLADAGAMVGYALLERVTRSLPAGAGDMSLHNRLLRALPGVPSGQPPVRLWALSRLISEDDALAQLFQAGNATATLEAIQREERFSTFRAEFNRYLSDWGFRCSEELMLTAPTLDDDPRPLIALLARQAQDIGSESPAEAMARQADAREVETRHLLRHLAFRAPHRALALWLTLVATRRTIAYRERARLKQALLYTRCRAVAREIGRRLTAAGRLDDLDDIFMLRWEEIDELLTGRAMFPGGITSLVRLRRDEHTRLAAETPPDAFSLETGSYMTSARQPDGAVAPETGVLTGTSASGGVATSRAAVLRGVDEAERLQKGDILVTRQTDPGWAPVFNLISGLVIERGGMLSHGAVIAREFGLPCVVGVREATRRIPHGQIVAVDGNAGTCIVLHPASGTAP